VAKASLCQGVTIPLLYLPLIFLITGAVRGLSIEDSFARAKASYLPLFLRNGRFWWPTQVVQFGPAPEKGDAIQRFLERALSEKPDPLRSVDGP